jgi:hypothetical protein
VAHLLVDLCDVVVKLVLCGHGGRCVEWCAQTIILGRMWEEVQLRQSQTEGSGSVSTGRYVVDYVFKYM